MRNKNSVYTVTPPDLKLNTIGPSVLLLGISLDDSQNYINLYEKLFLEVELTFFVSDTGFKVDDVPWFRATAGIASSIFVDLDKVTTEELFLAMQAERDNRAMVFWISKEKKYPSLVSLLNSYQYQIFTTLDEVEAFLLNEYRNNS